jgi:hypothetical protein
MAVVVCVKCRRDYLAGLILVYGQTDIALLTLNDSPIFCPRELFRQVPQYIQRPVRVRRIRGKQDGPDEAGIILTVLRTRNAMKVDKDGQTQFLGPVYGLNKVWVLSMVKLVR